MDTYSIDGDVKEKLANIKVASGILTENFRTVAYNRINSKLRKLYVVPVETTDVTDIALLCRIESTLAAGRLLMAVAVIDQLENIHEYGKYLVENAESDLKEILKEEVVLSSLASRATSDDSIDPPTITGSSADTYSTFDRPMSGIENDAIEGVIDAEKYNELEDIKTV